jgi:hypothetical protein
LSRQVGGSRSGTCARHNELTDAHANGTHQ